MQSIRQKTIMRSIHSTITFVIWSVAGAVTAAAWVLQTSDNVPLSCHHHSYPKNTILNVLSEEIGVSIEIETVEETEKIPYVIQRGDGSIGGGGLPMPGKHKSSKNTEEEDDDDIEELRRPKVSAEMPKG